jgi:hypothetical protein
MPSSFADLPEDVVFGVIAPFLLAHDYGHLSMTCQDMRRVLRHHPHKTPQECVLARLQKGFKDGVAYVQSPMSQPPGVTLALRKYESTKWLTCQGIEWDDCYEHGDVHPDYPGCNTACKRRFPRDRDDDYVFDLQRFIPTVQETLDGLLDEVMPWFSTMTGIEDRGHEFFWDSFLVGHLQEAAGPVSVFARDLGVLPTGDDENHHPSPYYAVTRRERRNMSHVVRHYVKRACERTGTRFMPGYPRLRLKINWYGYPWPVFRLIPQNGVLVPYPRIPMDVQLTHTESDADDPWSSDEDEEEEEEEQGQVQDTREVIDLTLDDD